MLPAILAQIGLPILIDILAGALGRVDHPAAKGASEALGRVGGAIKGREIPPELVAEANRHIEALAGLESAEFRETISEVNATIRQESLSEDPYVRRMRPTFGYIMAASWAAQMLAVAYVIVVEPARAGPVVDGLAALTVMWSVGLSVLGIYVYKRSADKAIGAGQPPSGALAALSDLLARRSAK